MEATKLKPPKRQEPDPEDPAIVLTYADLDCLGRSLRKNFTQDKDEFLDAIRALTQINVEGIPITLEPKLLTRLKSRCLDKASWPSWLKDIVTKQLHDYAGW